VFVVFVIAEVVYLGSSLWGPYKKIFWKQRQCTLERLVWQSMEAQQEAYLARWCSMGGTPTILGKRSL